MCDCASARNTQNSSYPSLLAHIVGNQSQREELFTWLYGNDNTNFQNIIVVIGGSNQNNLSLSLADLTTEITTNGIGNIMS